MILKFIQMAYVFIAKTEMQDNTLIITVVLCGPTKHLGFLPLYTELSIFVIKISYKQNSQE